MVTKVIVIIRASTVRQEIEAQKKEICDYARSFGYTNEEILVVGESGASAITLNQEYMKNLNFIYETIETTPSIECVFAWSLDRIARKDYMLLEFKNFLITHKVNLLIKNPSLTLFNPDGTVNTGVELAMSLFATMAQQEMDLKGERFMRAKKAEAAQGKFIGARYMHFGYTTNKDGFLVIDEEEAQIVRLAFELYTTGKYSCATLAKELNERGYKIRGMKFGEGQIINLLKDTAYIGYLNRNKLFKKYPPIVTTEQFEAVAELRDSRNNCKDKSTKHISLALKILKCFDCGTNYIRVATARQVKYMCYKRKYKSRFEPEELCTDSCSINCSEMDEILRDLSFSLRFKQNTHLTETAILEMRKRKQILLQKIETSNAELNGISDMSAKVLDAYTDNLINTKQYESRIEKIKAKEQNLQLGLKAFAEELGRIDHTLDNANKQPSFEDVVEHLQEKINEDDPNVIKEVIDKYIKVAYPKAIKVNGTNLTLIMVVDYDNNIYNYIFHQKHITREGLYKYEDGVVVPYPHRELLKGASPVAISKAMQDIMDSKELMNDLNKIVSDLNKKVCERILL